jgi:hypothetical protein
VRDTTDGIVSPVRTESFEPLACHKKRSAACVPETLSRGDLRQRVERDGDSEKAIKQLRTHIQDHTCKCIDVGVLRQRGSRYDFRTLPIRIQFSPQFRGDIPCRTGAVRRKPGHLQDPGDAKITDACDVVFIHKNV